MKVTCKKCGKRYDRDVHSYICPKCSAYYRPYNPNDSTIDIMNDPRFRDSTSNSSGGQNHGRGYIGNADSAPYRVSKPNVDYDAHGKVELNKSYSERKTKPNVDYCGHGKIEPNKSGDTTIDIAKFIAKIFEIATIVGIIGLLVSSFFGTIYENIQDDDEVYNSEVENIYTDWDPYYDYTDSDYDYVDWGDEYINQDNDYVDWDDEYADSDDDYVDWDTE